MKNGKICILIADDEKEIRDILRLLLTGEGYAVCTAENGREALALASAEVDLYLLDVNMPELSGFMAGAEIRKQFDAPIIFLTAYSGESDKVMGFSVGADDYIVKPFSNMELLMRVKAILRRSARGAVPTREEKKNHIQLHRLLVDQRRHFVFKLPHSTVQIGLDGGRKEQPGIVGAEVVQVEIDGPLNESGDAAASILPISSLQACLFLRGEIEGKFFFLAQNELLSRA